MRRRDSKIGNAQAFLQSFVIETLESRNAASSLSLVSTTFFVSSSKEEIKPTVVIVPEQKGLPSLLKKYGSRRTSDTSIPGRILVALPQKFQLANSLRSYNLQGTSIPDSQPHINSPQDTNNQVLIRQSDSKSDAPNLSGSVASQPLGGGVGTPSGLSRVGSDQRNANSTAAASRGVIPNVDLMTNQGQLGSSIRPLRMGSTTTSSRTGSNGPQNNSFSGGGIEQTPHIEFATLTMQGRTDNEDPDHPGVYNKTTAVSAVIGGGAGVSGKDGLYDTFNVSVSGNAVTGDPDIQPRVGMQPAGDYGGDSFVNQVDPGASWKWNQFSGTATVEVSVTYPNGNYGSAKFVVDVQNVTGQLTVTPAQNPHQVTNANGTPTAFQGGVGITGTLTSVPYVSGGGVFGFIQTMDPADAKFQFHNNNVGYTINDLVTVSNYQPNQATFVTTGTPSKPRPIIDDKAGTFYAANSPNSSSIGFVDGATGQITPLSTSDSPGVNISSASTAGDKYTYNTTFTDTLIYCPSGGIYVPLGKLTWTVSFEIEKLANGTYQVNSAPAIVPTGYSQTYEYPTWIESYAYLLSQPYQGRYITSP